ncbi:circadian clock-controlled protein daywake [Anabrus simplex]|uniref:circadian clock-controlled protein daywake n=1 Tax=Anabrus simplex TaxID=316456 RepID=UPI0035A35EBA
MSKLLLVLVTAAVVSYSATEKLPAYITACKEDDPNLNACALGSAKKAFPQMVNGDKKYGIPSLNPLVVEKAEIPGNGLDLTFMNAKLHGLPDTDIRDVKFDTTKQYLEVNFLIPHLYVDSDYKIDGKLLVVPLKGDGKTNITLTDVDLTYKANYLKEKAADGEDHIKLQKPDFDFKVSRAYIRLENLFNGDKALSDATHKFLDENWEDVVKELGPPILEIVHQISSNILGNIASRVPYKDFWA